MKDHPKKVEMDNLSNYHLLQSEIERANTRGDFKRKDELIHEFNNRKKQIYQLHDQIKREIFFDGDVIFNPSEKIDDTDLLIFRPDVQMIANAKFYDKVNVLKTLAQVTI